jgi:hypothetical protein
VIEVMGEWPRQFAAVAARVRVPVHLRLAEHERIWDNSPAALDELARGFSGAPEANIGLLPDGGHLYEVHKRGHELVADQLGFLRRAVLEGAV